MVELLFSESGRKKIIEEIKGFENVERKKESYKQDQIYKGHSRSYIIEYLRTQFSDKTVTKMPIISTINLCKRIVDKQASIYVENPTRTFTELNDEQKELILNWYKENKVNSHFNKLNKSYKNQEQSFLMLAPDGTGKLKIRVLKPHNLDVLPNDIDPEKADAYMVNAFDKSLALTTTINNEQIADSEDYKSVLEKYVVWTKDNNFIFNGKGEVETQVLPNPIKELPFIDVSTQKDFEFFVQLCNSIADFNIQFLSGLSDLSQVVKMQGWAVGYLKATKETMPEFVTIGPNLILKLTIDPNSDHVPDFGYASPSADIAGSISFIESILAAFLTSRGMDSSVVSTKLGTSSYSSGIERLLSMIDQFEATKEDFDLFENVESQFYNLFKKWNNIYLGTNLEILPFLIPDESKILINYKRPEMILGENEKLDLILKKKENGLISRVEAIMQDRNISKEEAEYIVEEIDEEDGLMSSSDENNKEEDESIPYGEI